MSSSVLSWALSRVARSLNLTQKQVENVYISYWSFIHHHASSLPLKEASEEQFNNLTTNFNIPYIGKLYVDYGRIRNYNNQLKNYQHVRNKENKANRLPSISD